MDELPEQELKDQLEVAVAVAKKLESEINTVVDTMEQKSANAEARRMMAERTAASLQAEADAIEMTGRKHTHLIMQWWLLGSLLAWLIGMVLSLTVSPVLGFIIFIPIVAMSLLLGYTSSNVEYKINVADMKRARARSRDNQPATDRDTEEFIGQLLGVDPSAQDAGGASGGYYDDGGSSTGSLAIKVVTTSASLVYNAAVLSVRAASWLLGSSSSSRPAPSPVKAKMS